MTSMNISNQALARLLELTKRPQVVAGKPQSQVVACVLVFNNNTCSTTSLVRDGKTSLSKFVTVAEGEGQIAIPDIDRLLGVLKFHGKDLTLSTDDGKLRVKSGSKQTTIISDGGGLAFPHSQETIVEWYDKSMSLDAQINQEGSYTLRDGTERTSFVTWEVNSTELFEAFRCDNMNGQKLNRYNISYMNGEIAVTTGDELKGKTNTVFEFAAHENLDPFQATFEGGLENVLKNMDGQVTLRFLDFRPEGQGIRMILDCGSNGYVFQASILM